MPGDVSLVAHDDVFPWLRPENFTVPLSTTRSSIRAAGARIAERLAARMSGLETDPRGEVWPVDLVVRASVAGARAVRLCAASNTFSPPIQTALTSIASDRCTRSARAPLTRRP